MVFRTSALETGFVSAVEGALWMVILVRQCGHARYGSGFSKERFTVFNGFVNDFLQDGF